jgi:molecular chaperone DnaK (HSP70)
LVYDLGSGTFDVSVIDCIDYKVLGLDGDNYFGGDTFDQRLVQHVAKEVKRQAGVDLASSADALQRTGRDCEKAKIKLSDSESATILVQALVDGTPVNVKVKVTRDEFERMIMELVDQTIRWVERAIAKVKAEDAKFAKEDVDSVLLVGGSTHIPLVQRRLRDYLGKEPCKNINSELAVAFGAATYAAMYVASPPIERGIHRVTVKCVSEVTAEREITINGRTSPGATVEARTPLGAVNGKADDAGKFVLTVALVPNTTNSIQLLATSTDGEPRRRELVVRHDDTYKGRDERVIVIVDRRSMWPRPLGIRVVDQDDLLTIVVPENSPIPCQASTVCTLTPSSRNAPWQSLVEIYEGDLPYAPLNTRLAQLVLEMPPSLNTLEPIEIVFQITEDQLLVVTAGMVNLPDHVVTATITLHSYYGDNLGVLDRFDRFQRYHWDTSRPEEKARLNKSKMGLLDLCEQYKRDSQEDKYEKIKAVGMHLISELVRLESQFS